jgi:hypothetical protein
METALSGLFFGPGPSLAISIAWKALRVVPVLKRQNVPFFYSCGAFFSLFFLFKKEKLQVRPAGSSLLPFSQRGLDNIRFSVPES